MPPAIVPHLDLSTIDNPWQMLTALADAGTDVSDLDMQFFRLVATRRSATERDRLIAAGLTVFGYRLADALRTVDLLLLERSAAL